MSGGSSSNARASSRIVSRPSGVSTSPLTLKAIAHSSGAAGLGGAVPAGESAPPRRATSIQCTGSVGSQQLTAARSRSAVGRPQVLVEITSQPTST